MGWFLIWRDVQWHYFKNNATLCDMWVRTVETKYRKKPGKGKVCEECNSKTEE